jgi:hypothetical protein
MLMFMNAWMMFVLMKCRCQNAKLNTGVLRVGLTFKDHKIIYRFGEEEEGYTPFN